MKLFQNAPTITKAIIIVGLLGACQSEKDAIVSPVTEQVNEANDENSKISFTLKRLISDGNVTMAYSGPQKLISKEYNANKDEYTEYHYADANQITGVKHNMSNQTTIETSVYVINSEGKCSESHHAVKGVPVNEVYIYKYNSDGLLEKKYNKNNPDERQEFHYSPKTNGKFNLWGIEYYNGNNVKYKELNYYYYNDKEETAKVNPGCIANGRGKYLPIFGNFHTNLIKQVFETTFTYQPTNSLTVPHEFSYTWNGQTEIVKEKTGVKIISTERKYATYGLL